MIPREYDFLKAELIRQELVLSQKVELLRRDMKRLNTWVSTMDMILKGTTSRDS